LNEKRRGNAAAFFCIYEPWRRGNAAAFFLTTHFVVLAGPTASAMD